MSISRLLFPMVALTLWVTPVKAQRPDTLALSQRVDQLEHQVAELQRRVAALEAPSQPHQTEAARPAPGDWKQIGNWRRLHNGMTMADVAAVLGQPTRVDAYTAIVFWYYGGGHVTFDGQSQTVTGWSEP